MLGTFKDKLALAQQHDLHCREQQHGGLGPSNEQRLMPVNGGAQ